MVRKRYGDQTNAPKLVPLEVLSDLHSSLGTEYVLYNEFMPEAITRINTKQTNTNHTITPAKNVHPG